MKKIIVIFTVILFANACEIKQRKVICTEAFAMVTMPELKNNKANFTFVGLINNQVVISESFVIKADECHVVKVSGVDSLNL